MHRQSPINCTCSPKRIHNDDQCQVAVATSKRVLPFERWTSVNNLYSNPSEKKKKTHTTKWDVKFTSSWLFYPFFEGCNEAEKIRKPEPSHLILSFASSWGEIRELRHLTTHYYTQSDSTSQNRCYMTSIMTPYDTYMTIWSLKKLKWQSRPSKYSKKAENILISGG